MFYSCCFFFSSRRRHTRYWRDWSSDVCSSDLDAECHRLDDDQTERLALRAEDGDGALLDQFDRVGAMAPEPWSTANSEAPRLLFQFGHVLGGSATNDPPFGVGKGTRYFGRCPRD